MRESAHRSVQPPCTDEHCITCSDEGLPMRVDSIDGSLGIASCASRSGERTEVMIALVDNVAVGDWLLVHAGTALTRLDADTGRAR